MPAKMRPNTGTAYLCGLLHNFGYLIMGHVFPPQFALINRHIEANPHINRSLLEKYLIGLTREQVSSLLMQQWRMPEEVVISLRSQHNPNYDGDFSTCANLLYVATRALRGHGFGDVVNRSRVVGLDVVVGFLGLLEHVVHARDCGHQRNR